MELDVYFRFLAALVFVLALIGAAAWAARRFGLGGKLAPNTGKDRRLSVVEVSVLDSRRKLVLVRRDHTEYLVLLGPGQDLLLESGIAASAAAEDGEAAVGALRETA
jgi:flagellar protein FliO/FliZ